VSIAEKEILEVAPVVQSKTKGVKRLIVVASLAMAALLPLGVYPRVLQSEELHASQSKAMASLPVVSVAPLQKATAEKALNLPGGLEAVMETQLYARTNGFVKKRLVDIGDKVLAGQLLAELETPEINDSLVEAKAVVLTNMADRETIEADIQQARANYQSALANLAQAKTSVSQLLHSEKFAMNTSARWKSLAQDGAVSAQDADEKATIYNTSVEATQAARDKVLAAQADVASAKAHISAEMAKLTAAQANVKAAQARASRSTSEKSFQNVVAPFAGVITERNIDQGNLISSGSDTAKVPLFKLERIDTLKVFVDVPQYSARAIKIGQIVKVSIREYPQKTFDGRVVRTAVSLDSTARTLKTEIHIDNKNLALAPGMYGEVKFTVPRPGKIYLIPSSALVMRSEGPQVIVVSGNETHYKNIQLGDDLGKEVEVISGLNGDEKIVNNPSDTLRDGTKIALRTTEETKTKTN
jgi:RND family efflux transporter MFP subunit